MNPINPALQRSYGSVMRSFVYSALATIALGAIVAMSSSCAQSGFKIPAVLPFDIGVRYEVEPGLFVVATPADKGGLDVKFEGTGAIGENITYDGTAWTITSPKTGIIYRITQSATGRPKIEIVGGGNGKLQLVPTTPPVSNPVLTEPVKTEPPPLPVVEAIP